MNGIIEKVLIHKTQRLFLLLALFSFSILKTNAQDFSFVGTVQDSLTDEVLPYAHIVVGIQKNNSINSSLHTSDQAGQFEISLESSISYTITFSYLGYFSKNVYVMQEDVENISKVIHLIQSSQTAGEVVIIEAPPPIIVKKDTTIFKVDSFLVGDEHKLKDILGNLPSVRVDDDNRVFFKGKEVKKLLIENKYFFNGNVPLGAEHIPADAIDEIEILEDYHDVSFLKGLSNGENLAMNLQLREDKNKFVFGDVKGGIGPEKEYQGHPNIFYYSPKQSASLIGDINNIGVPSISAIDYLYFRRSTFDNINLSTSQIEQLEPSFGGVLSSPKASKAKSNFGGINSLFSLSKGLSASTILLRSSQNTTNNSFGESNYLNDTTERFTEKTTSESNVSNHWYFATMNMRYDISNNTHLSYSTEFESSAPVTKGEQTINSISQVLRVNEVDDQNTNQYKQFLTLHKRHNSKHTSSVLADYRIIKSKSNLNWLIHGDIVAPVIPIDIDTVTNLFEKTDYQVYSTDLIFRHNWIINPTNHVYFWNRYNLVSNNITTKSSQITSSGVEKDFSFAGFNNDQKLKISDLNFGFKLKRKFGDTQIEFSLSGHQYRWTGNQGGFPKSKLVFLPSLIVHSTISNVGKIKATYELRSSIDQASQYLDNFVLQSYRSIFRGNPNLENSLVHSINVNFNRSDLFKDYFLLANFTYERSLNSIIGDLQVEGVNVFTSIVHSDFPRSSFRSFVFYHKNYNWIGIDAKLNFSYSAFNQERNGIDRTLKASSFNPEISLKLNLPKGPVVHLNQRFSYHRTNTDNIVSISSSHSSSVKVSKKILKHTWASTKSSYNVDYGINNSATTMFLLDFTALLRMPSNNIDIKFEIKNVFNNTTKLSSSSNIYLISDRQDFLLPRRTLISMALNL